jgi:hypothetical protein
MKLWTKKKSPILVGLDIEPKTIAQALSEFNPKKHTAIVVIPR